MTECKTKMADWITAWLYHCNNGDSHKDWDQTIYRVNFAAGFAGPSHGADGVLKPDTAGVQDCYEAGGQQACHIAGQFYLFGEFQMQGVEVTAEQHTFGQRYRGLYGE